MATIKGFTTKQDVPTQLVDAGADIVLSFEATNFKTKKNPFKKAKIKDRKGKLFTMLGKKK
jgi:hypothetical protein|tara:strand:- start:357 stop:539 length:183 start_codon:yes stop_codon:yes gene_type:complete